MRLHGGYMKKVFALLLFIDFLCLTTAKMMPSIKKIHQYRRIQLGIEIVIFCK